MSLQDRLCSADAELAARLRARREDRGSLLRGVLWALPFALAFWIGAALLIVPSWLDGFIRWVGR